MNRRVVFGLLAFAALAMAAPMELAAQERRITGRVLQAVTQQPLPGAAVSVIGAPATSASLTDADGRFTMLIPVGEVRLEVTAFGHTRTEIVVAAEESSLQILLQQDIFRLEELVVTGQATTIERRSATTSVAYVSGEDLGHVTSPSVLNSMAGKISGVSLTTNSGAPGGGIQMQIRGVNTILGGHEPLFVVDGVIYSNVSIPSGRGYANAAADPQAEADPVNRIADLNPADIASIEVLKGAAASSIYGSKAANGVVVITTTRGQTGAPQFNLVQRVGISTPLRLMESRKWTEEEAVEQFEGAEDAIRQFFADDPNPYHDNFAKVYDQRKPSYETTLSVRGGTESTRYFASGTVNREEGIERNTGAGRQSLRVNLDQTLGRLFDLGLSSAYNRNVNDRGWNNNCNNNGCHGYALSYVPSFIDISQRNADGTYINPDPYVAVQSNSLQLTELGINHEETNRFVGAVRLGWNAMDRVSQELRIVGAGGFDYFDQSNDIWSPNELYFEQTQTWPGEAIRSGGRNLAHNWNLNAIHSWDLGAWTATTSFGLQYEDRRLHTSMIRTQNLLPGQRNVNRGTETTATEALERERTLALYASEQLRLFDARLLVQAGVRAERSSVNGDIGRYYFFPNTSASYRLLDLIGPGSEVKLRVAYGETGNQPTFGQKYTTLSTPRLGGQQGLSVSTTAGFADVEPERLKEIEVGLDGFALDNRVTWELTGFTRTTTNLLLMRAPAPSSGFTSQAFNGGELRTTGIELGFGVTPIQRPNGMWISRMTFTRYTTEVMDLAGLPAFFPPGSGFGNLGRTFVEEGKPVTQIIGYRMLANGERSNDLEQLGDSEPDFRFGFVNDVRYRNFDVTAVVDWQKGGHVINLTRYLQDDGGTTSDWGSATWEKRVAAQRKGSIEPYVEDASFVKLREIALMYNVPTSLTDGLGLGLRNVRVGVSGRNLFMWAPYSGLDPEVANFGSAAVRNPLDIAPYPPMRSFYFNIAVGF